MVLAAPIEPVRMTFTPGTSRISPARSSYAAGLSSGSTTDAADAWSSRGAAGDCGCAVTTVSPPAAPGASGAAAASTPTIASATVTAALPGFDVGPSVGVEANVGAHAEVARDQLLGQHLGGRRVRAQATVREQQHAIATAPGQR